MQSPEKVLSILAQKSKSDDNFRFKRLYRNLYNKDFFYQAYAEISTKEGNMTAGTDNETIDGITIAKIDKLINKLKDYSYQPNPVRRTYIRTKWGLPKLERLNR